MSLSLYERYQNEPLTMSKDHCDELRQYYVDSSISSAYEAMMSTPLNPNLIGEQKKTGVLASAKGR